MLIFLGYNQCMRWLTRITDYLALTLFMLFAITTSNVQLLKIADRVNLLASEHAFNFGNWVADALWIKLTESAIAAPRYFTTASQHQVVVEYLQLVDDLQKTEHAIKLIYTDPNEKDPVSASAALRDKLATLNRRQRALAPLAEAVLQMQVTIVLKDLGLTTGGQPIPWVLYHVTPLPQNLVISPREVIRQETSYMLQPDLTVDQAATLENTVSQRLGVSSIVVDLGGLAVYPTMIMRTTALDWLSNTIAHEWIHLYLGQRPLGMNYDRNPELRTMNETTASIAGNEIGHVVLERYYPELVSRDPLERQVASIDPAPPAPPAFDYRAEMHTTRVHADELLAAGKIDEAEVYMDQRRQVFWDNGYAIRKLNQAFFAFYGAYADVPGGAAGEDPVGPAVRKLREQSASLTDFLERIAQMDSFAALQAAVK
jgi:hypothetical protein